MVTGKQHLKIVLSASRRTDIPAFYMEWFMNQMEKGEFEITNPYNQKISKFPVSPETVHSIVFWSKNFKRFLEGGYGKTLRKNGYGLFFNFTVNSTHPLLEPNIPLLDDRLNQMKELCGQFGPEAVSWRFDPICFYKTKNEGIHSNLDNFKTIAGIAAQNGIKRCVTSFMDDYKKIRKRVRLKGALQFIFPDIKKKIAVLLRMERVLSGLGISLYTCCEKTVMDSLPKTSSISSSACIPGEQLMELYGGNISLKKDKGQRIKAGCRCRVSRDIGSYAIHPCFHNCLFCYANPACDNS